MFSKLWRLLGAALLFAILSASAQNLGEIARKERERKQKQQRRATRVYTNDDLKRAQILDPADRERFLAARRQAAPSAEEVAMVVGSLPLELRTQFVALVAPNEIRPLPAYVAAFLATRSASPAPAEEAPPQVTTQPGDASLLTLAVPQPASPANAGRMAPRGPQAREAEAPPQISAAPAHASLLTLATPRPAAPVNRSNAAGPVAPPVPAAEAAPEVRGPVAHNSLMTVVPASPRRPALTTPSAPRAGVIAPQSKEEVPLGDIARQYRIEKLLRENPAWNAPPELPPPAELAAPDDSRLPPVTATELRAPEPEAAAAALPLATAFGALTHVRVLPGDSLWKLAALHLGDGARWPELAALNPQLESPSLIRVGEWIRLRDENGAALNVAAVEENPNTAAAAQEHHVRRGDSLWKVAEARFGSGLAWACIARANPQVRDVDLIFPGQRLAVPRNCSAVPAQISARARR